MPEITWKSPTAGELDLSSGQKARFRTLAGVVADDQHKADTRFYSVGGGGYVGPHGGSVAAPEIRSVTDNYQTIWITDAGGTDHSVSLTNMEVPLRVGQRITVLVGGFQGRREGIEVVANHSSQLFYNLARGVRTVGHFEKNYFRAGWLLRLLLWLTFLGSFLIFSESFQPAGPYDYRYWSVEGVCRFVEPPKNLRITRLTPQQLAEQRSACVRRVEADNEKMRTAWHAWQVPVLSAASWFLLVIYWWRLSSTVSGRLREEYLGALDSWGRLALARGAGRGSGG